MKLKRVILLRHGEFEGNVNRQSLVDHPDVHLPLTDTGHQQAIEAAQTIAQLLSTQNNVAHVRIWCSGYVRARETAQEVSKHLVSCRFLNTAISSDEDILLNSQQYGLFDGLTRDQKIEHFPAQIANHKKLKRGKASFYSKNASGESPFDVAVRVRTFMETLHRDTDNVDTIILAAHRAVLPVFTFQWMKYPWQWWEEEPVPLPGSVRLLARDDHGIFLDHGYIHKPAAGSAENPYIVRERYSRSPLVSKVLDARCV